MKLHLWPCQKTRGIFDLIINDQTLIGTPALERKHASLYLELYLSVVRVRSIAKRAKNAKESGKATECKNKEA